MHSQRPTKRFWWGSAACDANRSGSLILHDMPELYGPIKEQAIIVRLYSAANHEYLESSLDAGDLEALHKGIEFSQLFDDAEKHLEGELGYFTLFSQYSGFYCHSSMNLKNGNATLEHAF